jgi:dihydroorotase
MSTENFSKQNSILIHNAKIINEGHTFKGSVLIEGDKISKIFKDDVPATVFQMAQVIDATDKYLIPGVIDGHVHFREPGLTQKADIASESKAAVAGGTTSFMDMPNTIPQTVSLEILEQKFELAAQKSLANYSFYLGATNDNISEVMKLDPKKVCGVKLFMGSSTGNMLVNEEASLTKIFAESPVLVAIHSEDDLMIKANMEKYKAELGEDIPFKYHPLIRSAEACYKTTAQAINFAHKYNSRLHVLHISTGMELSLFDGQSAVAHKQITAETAPQYLWFDDSQYDKLGARMKCNPAIKSAADKNALTEALNNNKIDVIGTDHAPHLLVEKAGSYWQAVSGMPQIQHSLVLMLELAKQGKTSVEKVIEKMCHAPATLYCIEKRGFIRKGYYADLVLVDRNKPWTVSTENILSKCGWSPYEGTSFSHKVSHTFVNGKLVYNNGELDANVRGERLVFNV